MDLEDDYVDAFDNIVYFDELGLSLIHIYQSYGIEVAKLAGLPIEVIDRAKHILCKLENEKSIEIDKLFNNYKESNDNNIKVKEEAAVEKEDVEVIEDKKVTEIPSINKTEKEPIVCLLYTSRCV